MDNLPEMLIIASLIGAFVLLCWGLRLVGHVATVWVMLKLFGPKIHHIIQQGAHYANTMQT